MQSTYIIPQSFVVVLFVTNLYTLRKWKRRCFVTFMKMVSLLRLLLGPSNIRVVGPIALSLARISHILNLFQKYVVNWTWRPIQLNWICKWSLTHHVYSRCMMMPTYSICSNSTTCFVTPMFANVLKVVMASLPLLGTFCLPTIIFSFV